MEHEQITLPEHEARSQERYQRLCDEIKAVAKTFSEDAMGMDNLTDKINVNVGGEGGGGGNAAMIAALLNGRNQDSNLGPLMAAMGGGGFGGNSMWPILLLALLGRRGFDGFGGGGDGGCGGTPDRAALLQTLLEGQSNLRAEVPTTALETQNAIQQALAALGLGTQQGFANVKDAVQNGIAFLDRDVQGVNQNVSSQGCQTREAVANDGDKTRALLVARFQQEDATRIAELNAEVVELRNEGRRRADHDELRIQVTNQNTATNTQSQAQAQFQVQSQFDRLFGAISVLGAQVQRVRADQDIVNLGTMVASGTQATTSTQVR